MFDYSYNGVEMGAGTNILNTCGYYYQARWDGTSVGTRIRILQVLSWQYVYEDLEMVGWGPKTAAAGDVFFFSSPGLDGSTSTSTGDARSEVLVLAGTSSKVRATSWCCCSFFFSFRFFCMAENCHELAAYASMCVRRAPGTDRGGGSGRDSWEDPWALSDLRGVCAAPRC